MKAGVRWDGAGSYRAHRRPGRRRTSPLGLRGGSGGAGPLSSGCWGRAALRKRRRGGLGSARSRLGSGVHAAFTLLRLPCLCLPLQSPAPHLSSRFSSPPPFLSIVSPLFSSIFALLVVLHHFPSTGALTVNCRPLGNGICERRAQRIGAQRRIGLWWWWRRAEPGHCGGECVVNGRWTVLGVWS